MLLTGFPDPHMASCSAVLGEKLQNPGVAKRCRTNHAFIVRGFRINPQIRTCSLSLMVIGKNFRIQEKRRAEEAMGPLTAYFETISTAAHEWAHFSF
jgi:hypothetical protein